MVKINPKYLENIKNEQLLKLSDMYKRSESIKDFYDQKEFKLKTMKLIDKILDGYQ